MNVCGLFGVVSEDLQFDWERVARHALNAIAHRGPDQRGVWSSAAGDARVVLGHVRLSIIDPEGGLQPMIEENAGLVLAYNGEVYNYRELRAELLGLGYLFREQSDTEVVLHSYQEWGERCVEHFSGMFALALWDQRRQQLYLARDAFGKKPLFWAQQGSTFSFASEIKALLQNPLVERRLNESALSDYFTYRYVPGPNTLLAGVQKLMPGSYAVWRNGKLREESYFTPPDRQALPATRKRPVSDPIAGFLERLRSAVTMRMVSDVPFGAFLSGGIDSSALVALMSEVHHEPIKTFSVGFAEAEYSELAFSRAVANRFATEHHELIISEQEVIEELPNMVRYRDAPVAEPADIPIYLLSRQARQHVKMVLTGEGSDEVLGGYPKHIFERWSPAYQALPHFLRDDVIEPLIHALPYRFRRPKTAIASLSIADARERLPRWFGVLSAKERSTLLAPEWASRKSENSHLFATSPNNSCLRRVLYFDQSSWLPDNLLERGDRMTMAASLEARMPFLDQELVAFVSGLPDRYRIRGATTKWILRKAMQHLLPKEILARKKVGFRLPVNEWFRGPMRGYLHDHLLAADSLTSAYYRPGALKGILQEHVSGGQNHEKLIWCLLSLEIWCRHYLAVPESARKQQSDESWLMHSAASAKSK